MMDRIKLAEEVESMLLESMEGALEENGHKVDFSTTFAELGKLTQDRGIVVKLMDGREVELTVTVK